MSRIPHTRRLGGRYVFQRRVHYRNVISKVLPLALRTADPKVARTRAAMLSARFAATKTRVDGMLEEGRTLTGTEIEALFHAELEKQLRFYVHSAYEDAPWSSSVPEVAAIEAIAYSITRRPDRHRELTDRDHQELTDQGHGADIREIEEYAKQIRAMLTDDVIRKRLEAIGAPAHDRNIAAARTHLIRATASACARVARVFDDDVMDAADPIKALLADLPPPDAAVRALLEPPLVPPPPMATGSAGSDTGENLFLVFDQRLFSEAIGDVLAELKLEGIWRGDLKQQRRIMETFAWITGDKPLGAYTHLDAAAFKKGIQQLPAKFSYGSLTKGTMTRPFAEVIASLPPVSVAARRNPKTVNRDLSTMATVAKHLATTSWMPRQSGAIIMNFGAGRIAIQDDPDLDTRPPWTTAHLEHLFHSPLYLGGGGALRRLHGDEPRRVWHDAAYWAPLLWFYHHTCREETCGLEVADIVAGHPTPHFLIRDNLTRGRDGEMAGEKRRARKRALPIHDELIRLGFLDYVEAIRLEGHTALFPELYLNAEKRGGAHLYERAWIHMVAYIGSRLPLPLNEAGKGPDIHSIRSLGSSFYEVDGVNGILRADVMGHAREGVNAKFYSKRAATEGLDVVLAERKAFIDRYVPTITAHLVSAPITLLPLEKRSRTGAAAARKRRSDARRSGTDETPPS